MSVERRQILLLSHGDKHALNGRILRYVNISIEDVAVDRFHTADIDRSAKPTYHVDLSCPSARNVIPFGRYKACVTMHTPIMAWLDNDGFLINDFFVNVYHSLRRKGKFYFMVPAGAIMALSPELFRPVWDMMNREWNLTSEIEFTPEYERAKIATIEKIVKRAVDSNGRRLFRLEDINDECAVLVKYTHKFRYR